MSPQTALRIAVPALALLAVVGTAAASIVLSYTNASSAGLGVKATPIQFQAGGDSVVSDYVPAFGLSANRTTFTASLRGVPEATVTIGDLVRLQNVDSRSHTVTLETTPVSNTLVTAYKIDWYNGASLVGTLDLKSTAPGVTFTNLAAGTTLTGKVTITLAAGAGGNNVSESRAIAMTTTP